jgi:hypothetical protein
MPSVLSHGGGIHRWEETRQVFYSISISFRSIARDPA